MLVHDMRDPSLHEELWNYTVALCGKVDLKPKGRRFEVKI